MGNYLTASLSGTCTLTVIVVGNGQDNQSSDLERDCLRFTSHSCNKSISFLYPSGYGQKFWLTGQSLAHFPIFKNSPMMPASEK